MKNKIIFALLTAIAAVAGLKLSSLSNGFLSRDDGGQTVVERSDIRTDALYIAQNDDELLDMFSQAFDSENAFPLANSMDDEFLKISFSDALELAVIDLCSCREEYAFGKPAEKSVAEALLTDGSEKIALQKYPYYNPAGELRYLDLVADKQSFQVMYIRFYSDDDDENLRLSATEMEQTVSRMNDELVRFSDALEDSASSVEWLSGGEFTSYDFYVDSPEEFILDASEKTRDEILTEISERFGYNRYYARENCNAPNELSKFVRDLSSCSLVRLTFYYDENEESANYIEFGGASIYSELVRFCSETNSIADATSYSVYRGEAYQTLSYENEINVVTIFDAKTRTPKGFLISDTTSNW